MLPLTTGFSLARAKDLEIPSPKDMRVSEMACLIATAGAVESNQVRRSFRLERRGPPLDEAAQSAWVETWMERLKTLAGRVVKGCRVTVTFTVNEVDTMYVDLNGNLADHPEPQQPYLATYDVWLTVTVKTSFS